MAKTPNLTSIDPENLRSISISPNPMKDKSLIKIEGVDVIDRVEAYDLSGRNIGLPYSIISNKIEIERGGIPAGLLLLKIWSKGEIIAVGKLAVE